MKATLRLIRFVLASGISLVRFKLRRRSDSRLEIGSGPARRSGWITLDQCAGADLVWDLRWRWPLKANSLDVVYASHVLEHFAFHDLYGLLAEIHRVLKPGGEFLIAVPDASLYVRMYESDLPGFVRYLTHAPAVISHKKMDVLNYIFYMDGHHKFMFDEENLIYHCEHCGFVNCERRTFDESLDSQARRYESLYMRCVKPL